ncbi:MAG: hypothetical protein VX505_10230 [Chloroflexota bacterium]|nr:hypothetical protein [Chloroflexota bacterium]GIS95314.1 MAG: hypothetical protein CM1200mP22_25510 [Dehalococcoidia bacterium]
MAACRQGHIEKVRDIKNDLLAILEGMDYCLDWKLDPTEWSARELIYHVVDTPLGGVNGLVKGILSGNITEYDLWSDLTNVTPERLTYDLSRIKADIEVFTNDLLDVLSCMSDADLEDTTVMMHQKTRLVDEERSIDAILTRTLSGHIQEHLVQLRGIREALAI